MAEASVASFAAEDAVTLFFVIVPALASNGQLVIRNIHGDVVLRDSRM